MNEWAFFPMGTSKIEILGGCTEVSCSGYVTPEEKTQILEYAKVILAGLPLYRVNGTKTPFCVKIFIRRDENLFKVNKSTRWERSPSCWSPVKIPDDTNVVEHVKVYLKSFAETWRREASGM